MKWSNFIGTLKQIESDLAITLENNVWDCSSTKNIAKLKHNSTQEVQNLIIFFLLNNIFFFSLFLDKQNFNWDRNFS